MKRLSYAMKLTRNFASDLIGGVITTGALFALLCWDFAKALFCTLVLGRTQDEQAEDLA
jgi:hypothetical protein